MTSSSLMTSDCNRSTTTRVWPCCRYLRTAIRGNQWSWHHGFLSQNGMTTSMNQPWLTPSWIASPLTRFGLNSKETQWEGKIKKNNNFAEPKANISEVVHLKTLQKVHLMWYSHNIQKRCIPVTVFAALLLPISLYYCYYLCCTLVTTFAAFLDSGYSHRNRAA